MTKRSDQASSPDDLAAGSPTVPLRGQVAVITGGASGIGLAVARALDRRGCRLVIASRNPQRVEQAVTSLGDALGVAPCDVKQPAAIEQLFARTVDHYGQVDIVVASAGIARSSQSARHVPSPLQALEESVWDDVVDTNLRGTFLTARAAARLMVPRRSGQIVGISSARAGVRGMAYGASYCASKMAARVLLEALADEVRAAGVRVFSVLPDVVETDMLAGTNLASGGALTSDQVGEYIAQLLELPPDATVEQAQILPLGSRQRARRPRSSGTLPSAPADESAS